MDSSVLQKDVLIVSTSDYREADALVVAIDPSDQRVTFVARGVLKPTSKNAAALSPLTKSRITYSQKGSMPLVHTATILEYYRPLKENLIKTAVASLCLELSSSLLHDQQRVEGMYDVLSKTLDALVVYDPLLVACWYVAKMSSWFGIGFYVDGCVVCESSKISAISIVEGGFVCQSCAVNVTHRVMEVDDYRFYRCIIKAEIDQFSKCMQLKTPTLEHLTILMEFFMEFTSIYPKSWLFLKNL